MDNASLKSERFFNRLRSEAACGEEEGGCTNQQRARRACVLFNLQGENGDKKDNIQRTSKLKCKQERQHTRNRQSKVHLDSEGHSVKVTGITGAGGKVADFPQVLIDALSHIPTRVGTACLIESHQLGRQANYLGGFAGPQPPPSTVASL